MRFKHIAICGVVGGILLGTAGLCNIKDAQGLMEYNTKYRTEALDKATHIVNYSGVPMLGTFYELDNDAVYDVMELRIIEKVDDKGVYYSNLEPIIYGFDMNKDGFFESKEMLFDEEMDGLNGNETKIKEEGGEKEWT